ncbi:hypothetical protein BRC93_14795 [Halobacteriales archaeon QS_5_70_15]|nr:MAG: hypothetical protein BRC93_14795 [Halobacteriales archaeon QS_5_70_15]
MFRRTTASPFDRSTTRTSTRSVSGAEAVAVRFAETVTFVPASTASGAAAETPYPSTTTGSTALTSPRSYSTATYDPGRRWFVGNAVESLPRSVRFEMSTTIPCTLRSSTPYSASAGAVARTTKGSPSVTRATSRTVRNSPAPMTVWPGTSTALGESSPYGPDASAPGIVASATVATQNTRTACRRRDIDRSAPPSVPDRPRGGRSASGRRFHTPFPAVSP